MNEEVTTCFIYSFVHQIDLPIVTFNLHIKTLVFSIIFHIFSYFKIHVSISIFLWRQFCRKKMFVRTAV